jgi:hypothetical protein
MTLAKKTGLILIIIGACLPTATLPFITEFHPHPELCLSSTILSNMGNMMLKFGTSLVIPYRYLFSLGVMLICTGLGIIVVYHPSPGQKQ